MAAVKLAITSDLYLGVTPLDHLERLARDMAGANPDAAVIAGDLAESLSDLTRCLKLFRVALSCPIWVLPGDHDFWARPPYDSRYLWRDLIPEAVAKTNCQYLEGKSFVHNGVGVAGTVAWYDYSSATLAGIVSDMEFAQQKYLYNADALRIDWEWSDPEFASLCGTPFLATLDQLEQDPEVKQTVVITHFPIIEQQLPRDTVKGLASAYLGNLTLGKKVRLRKKVSHIISGHAHLGREYKLEREIGTIEVRVLPGDYDKPAWLALNVG
jgi:Calcineurin-like phosphoesterase